MEISNTFPTPTPTPDSAENLYISLEAREICALVGT